MKKMLCVDFGEVRTGLARTDALGLTAVGLGIIKSYNIENTALQIARKAAENGSELIVIGHPMNMNGSLGEKSERVHYLGELISSHTDIPIVYFDERLTTVQAHSILRDNGMKTKKHKEVVDSLSAELILQNYMDLQNNLK